MHVTNRTRGTVLATRCEVAGNFLAQGIGLMGRGGIGEGAGLLIPHTNLITMLFMRFAIDAVFIDHSWRVVSVKERLAPWVPAAGARGADSVIELPAGTASRTGTQVGDELTTEPART